MKQKYYWRNLLSLWFERYLIFCGAILNGLFIIGVISFMIPDREAALQRRFDRARAELEHGPTCDKLMSNAQFKPGVDFDLLFADGRPLRLRYADKGVNSRNQSGFAIHMVEMEKIGFLFFEVDERERIRRCIPESMLECVNAEGTFDQTVTAI